MTLPLWAYHALSSLVGCFGWCLAQLEIALPSSWSLPWKAWNLPQRFGVDAGQPCQQGNPVWIHAASLGEVAGVLQIVKHLPLRQPCILTAQTTTGIQRLQQFAKEWNANPSYASAPITVSYPPWDNPNQVHRFLKRHAISKLALYEGEYWPGMIQAAHRSKIPIYGLAARWGKGSQRLGSVLPQTVRELLRPLHQIQARSEWDAEKIRGFYSGTVTAGCDIKSLGATSMEAQTIRLGLALYCVHRTEWPWLKPHIAKWMALAPVFVMPRYPQEFDFFRTELAHYGFQNHTHQGLAQVESRAGGAQSDDAQVPRKAVLVDALGCCPDYLRHCQVAFVGGTLNGQGGHAFWEPLRYGLRLVTGPDVFNQAPWVSALQSAQLLQSVPTGNSLALERAMHPLSPEALSQQTLRISTFLEGLNASQSQALRELRAIFQKS